MGVRMVQLTTCGSRFEAQLLVVRLGADGIVTEARSWLGPSYPLGRVDVYVEEGAFRVARQLLLPLEGDYSSEEVEYRRPWYRRRWVKIAGIVALGATAAARVV